MRFALRACAVVLQIRPSGCVTPAFHSLSVRVRSSSRLSAFRPSGQFAAQDQSGPLPQCWSGAPSSVGFGLYPSVNRHQPDNKNSCARQNARFHSPVVDASCANSVDIHSQDHSVVSAALVQMLAVSPPYPGNETWPTSRIRFSPPSQRDVASVATSLTPRTVWR